MSDDRRSLNSLDDIEFAVARIEELEAELAALERWRAAAFIAHGNLDLDIEADPQALAELKGGK